MIDPRIADWVKQQMEAERSPTRDASSYLSERLSEPAMDAPEMTPGERAYASMQPGLANFMGGLATIGGVPNTFKEDPGPWRNLEQRQRVAEFMARQRRERDDLVGKAMGVDAAVGRAEYNKQEVDRRKQKDAVDAKLAEDRLELDRLRLDAKKRAGDDARTIKAKEAVQKLEGAKISYFNDVYEPISGAAPDSTIQNRARDFLSKSANAVTSIAQFRDKLKAAIAKPVGPERKRALADLGVAATALNSFLGQGAMAEGEFARVKESLGQPGGVDYLLDVARRFVSGDENELSNALARTDETLALVRRITDESVKPLGYIKGGQSQPTKSTQSKLAPGRYKDKNTGKTIIVDENGNKRFE